MSKTNTDIEPGPVTVIGSTTWGTTLAIILARRNIRVRLVTRTVEEAIVLTEAGENTRRLPGHPFPGCLSVTADYGGAFEGTSLVIYATPANSIRENLEMSVRSLYGNPLLLIAAKGLERGSNLRMSQVAEEVFPKRFYQRICILSGPNLAREIIEGKPASTVIAASNPSVAEEAQQLLNSVAFRVYTNSDVVGVEFAGALKNIIAIGAGVSDGLNLGSNAKAAFINRGLAEITRLGVAFGADPKTFSGLAGQGDLMTTCYSSFSRNRYVGEQIALGRPLTEVLASMGEVAEGVSSVGVALHMARQLSVALPIVEITNKLLFEGLDPRQGLQELLHRAPRAE